MKDLLSLTRHPLSLRQTVQPAPPTGPSCSSVGVAERPGPAPIFALTRIIIIVRQLRDLLDASHLARYDGSVARYVGDGILTYFGWPAAHEDDAERCPSRLSLLPNG
jgi:hypothetical protein